METLFNHLLELVALAVLALGGLAIRHLADWLRLRADSEVRAYLMAGLERAVQLGVDEARRRAGPGGVALAHIAQEAARDYAQARFPDALRRFGVDTTALDEMIRARLPPSAG